MCLQLLVLKISYPICEKSNVPRVCVLRMGLPWMHRHGDGVRSVWLDGISADSALKPLLQHILLLHVSSEPVSGRRHVHVHGPTWSSSCMPVREGRALCLARICSVQGGQQRARHGRENGGKVEGTVFTILCLVPFINSFITRVCWHDP